MDNQSEVALIRQRIDQEIGSLRRLKYGFARVASHEIITNRYDFIGECYQELAGLIGEQKAAEEVTDKLDGGLAMEEEEKPGTPITELTNIPINVPFIEKITTAVTLHGATIQETLDKTYPGYTGERHGYKEFTVRFPVGTRRVDQQVLRNTTPFTITFPDGFELLGTSVYPGHRGPDDPETIILYVPGGCKRR